MEQRPAIFKLNLDCFDHVFDYLSLEDLGQFSQTCKAMKAAVGEYYQANYGIITARAILSEKNLYLESSTMSYSDFIQRLMIIPVNNFHMMARDSNTKRDLSKKVTEIFIKTDRFTKTELHHLEYIINNAEILDIICVAPKISNLFDETVPSMCNSLKRLHMRQYQCYDAAQTQDGNKWLLREYPTLKHLEWTQHRNSGYKINEIKAFFELNPNVRSFATNVNCLWESQQLIIESGVKLDDLTIEVGENEYRYGDNPQRTRDIWIVLNKLHKKGVYKRLHLKFSGYYNEPENQVIQQIIDQIIPINSVRSIKLPTPNVNLSKLVNLVELRLDCGSEIVRDLNVMAKYLMNLERVHFEQAFLEEMLSFIHHSVKLKKLKVSLFSDGDENVSSLDLANMNKRREQLLDATKVIIFIEEAFYFATKWASTLTDYRLIEMRLATAHEWGHHFGSYL